MTEVDVEYVENKDGVHLLHPLYSESSLCGDSVYLFEDDLMIPTSKKSVTCERCAEIIKATQDVKTKAIKG